MDVAVRHRPAEELPELKALLQLACGMADLRFHAERPWASATFHGTRHTVALDFIGIEAVTYAEAFIAELPRTDMVLAGKMVADASIIAVDRTNAPRTDVVLELLVLEN